jgi:hypothetical protein
MSGEFGVPMTRECHSCDRTGCNPRAGMAA